VVSGKRVAIPGPLPGNSLRFTPEPIRKHYDEARRGFSAGSFTACHMMMRKLLMYIAVANGAEEGLSFQEYVN
jgi:hypothetical protein